MPVFSFSMSARIRSAPTVPLSFLSPAVWHVAHTPGAVVASIASDGFWIAWLLWHSTQPLSNRSLWTLFSNFCAKIAWHVPHTFDTDPTPGGAAPWLPWQSLHVGAERSLPFVSAR